MSQKTARESDEYEKAYIDLGGESWTLRRFYTSGGLTRFLRGVENIVIVTLESFVAQANRGQL